MKRPTFNIGKISDSDSPMYCYLTNIVQYATTTPWDKVLMGSYTQLFKNELDPKALDNDNQVISYKGLKYDKIK